MTLRRFSSRTHRLDQNFLAEQLKGAIKKTWAKLTDDDILLIDGQRDQFLGKLKEHYGLGQINNDDSAMSVNL